jgi:hypothetical protein
MCYFKEKFMLIALLAFCFTTQPVASSSKSKHSAPWEGSWPFYKNKQELPQESDQITNDVALNKKLIKLNIVPPKDQSHEKISDLNQDEKLISSRFAPLVIFHPSERFFPCSVEWFATQCYLVKRENDVLTHIKQIDDVSELGNLKYEEGITYKLKPIHTGKKLKQFYAGEPLVGGYYSDAPVYANFVKKDENHAVIQYWFFYSYNGPTVGYQEKGIGIHEGDWEHIDVHIHKKDGSFEIEKVFYAAHRQARHGKYVLPDKMVYYKGTHPIVYSAKYSHASLPNIPTLINAELDTAGIGKTYWPTYNHVVLIGTKDNPKPGQEWIKFNGSWGSFGSPQTPSYQGYWRHAGSTQYNKVPLDPGIVFNEKGETPRFSLRNKVPTRSLKICFEVDSQESFEYTLMHEKKLGKDELVYGPLKSGEVSCQDRERLRPFIIGPKDYKDRSIHGGLYFKSTNPQASKGLKPMVTAPES